MSLSSLRHELSSLGLEADFIKTALEYAELYNGNLELFIVTIREIVYLQESLADKNSRKSVSPPMDKGVWQTELDYNGDVLDYWGFSFSEEHIRY